MDSSKSKLLTMKFFACSFLCIFYFAQHLVAQNKIYIKPLLESKASCSYVVNEYFKQEYFQLKKQPVIWPHKLSPLHFGVLFGYKLNRKLNIELGISQDAAISGYKLHIQTKTGNSINQSGLESSIGTAGFKIPLVFNYCFYESPLGSNKVNLILGANYYRQPKSKGFIPYHSTGFSSVSVDDSVTLSVYENDFVGQYKSWLYSAGLSTELYYKTAYLFNFGIYYQFALKSNKPNELSVQNIVVEINNKNNITNYGYTVYSKGSGIVFQLSRRISKVNLKRNKALK